MEQFWHPELARVLEEHRARHEQILALIAQLNEKADKTMSALTDLQNADAALKAEVATFLADVASALTAEDPDIEAVVSDINAQVTALQGADPVTGTSATPPAAPAAPAS